MKTFVKYLLQSILGFQRYLYCFSIFKIYTLKWDKKENDFFSFLQLIKNKTGTILDIGANIGIMSFHLSKKFPNNQIYSIEPIPSNLKILYKIIQIFKLKNVQVLSYALGNYDGKASMLLPKEKKVYFQGLSYVIKENSPTEGIKYEVEIKRLDSFEFSEKIIAIKIDVENYEFEVFQGAKQLLIQHKPIIYCELWENDNREKSFQILTEIGYQIYIFKDKKLIPFQSEIHQSQNFIFCCE